MGVGASASSLSEHPGVTTDVIDFCACFEKLAENSEEGKAARQVAWRSLDNNGNRHVSLAEADTWIKTTLTHKYHQRGEKLWKTFRRSYIRAFKDAADAGVDKEIKGMATATEDDMIERGEFRLFCAYLCLYSLMFDAFKYLDGSHAREQDAGSVFTAVEAAAGEHDHKISQEEWMTGYAQLAGSPFYILNECATNPEAAEGAWPMMDADGKGSVLLVEFCEWIKAWEVQTDSAIGHILDAGARDPSGRRIE